MSSCGQASSAAQLTTWVIPARRSAATRLARCAVETMHPAPRGFQAPRPRRSIRSPERPRRGAPVARKARRKGPEGSGLLRGGNRAAGLAKSVICALALAYTCGTQEQGTAKAAPLKFIYPVYPVYPIQVGIWFTLAHRDGRENAMQGK